MNSYTMSLETLLIFIPACFALNMAPGPNNLLSVSNAARYGFWAAAVAGIGRLSAFAGMIALAAAGLAYVLQASEYLFHTIKVIGAAYLFHLAFQLWNANPGQPKIATAFNSQGTFSLARQEFLVALGNPKAILIFTAFLPQFIDPKLSAPPQFAALGALFLVLEWVAVAAYSFFGTRLHRSISRPRRLRAFNRLCGVLLGVSGIGLLFARRA
jgi:threonine/homoserine/homoserine lactone efflux protein